jgi:hypothetical protein
MRIRCWNIHLEEMLEARVPHLEGILKRKRSSPSTLHTRWKRHKPQDILQRKNSYFCIYLLR